MAQIDVVRVEQLAAGRSCGSRDNRAFVEIVREADGSLAVDCGWVVPEGDEDDYRSFNRHPFKDGRQRPWVGRRSLVSSASEALELYELRRTQVWGGTTPADGEPIGSVVRGR